MLFPTFLYCAYILIGGLMDILSFIGRTPTVRLRKIEEYFGVSSEIFGKAEFLNPGGSIKDRVAYAMLSDAEKSGLISAGSVIVESTSGNTGVALAMIGAIRGYRIKIVMPSGASEERAMLMRSFGAEVISVSGDMSDCIHVANDIMLDGAFMPDQFTNSVCTECHYHGTAMELLTQLNGKIDIFISGVGTGATISGIGRRIKEHRRVEIIAVEPKESCVISGGERAPHGIEGLGAGFVPKLYDPGIVDRVETVSTDEAVEMTRILAKKEGILAGISTGANLAVAIKIGKRRKARIAIPLCDRGERYFSRNIF